MTCTHAATEVADACIGHCPICQRDEIAALTARAEKAEAEVERLREALEALEDKDEQSGSFLEPGGISAGLARRYRDPWG